MLEDIRAIEQALLETLLTLLSPYPTPSEFKAFTALLGRLSPATLQALPLDIQQQLQTYLGQAYPLNWQADVLH